MKKGFVVEKIVVRVSDESALYLEQQHRARRNGLCNVVTPHGRTRRRDVSGTKQRILRRTPHLTAESLSSETRKTANLPRPLSSPILRLIIWVPRSPRSCRRAFRRSVYNLLCASQTCSGTYLKRLAMIQSAVVRTAATCCQAGIGLQAQLDSCIWRVMVAISAAISAPAGLPDEYTLFPFTPVVITCKMWRNFANVASPAR